MTESKQYAAGEHPDWEPPVTSIGVIGWLRKNLFDGYVNSILTLFALYLLYLYVPPLIEWVFLDAVWSGDSREVCEVEGAGACWAGVCRMPPELATSCSVKKPAQPSVMVIKGRSPMVPLK